MAAYHWPAWEQERCQDCEAPAGAPAPLRLLSVQVSSTPCTAYVLS